jgi:hypothetical protein
MRSEPDWRSGAKEVLKFKWQAVEGLSCEIDNPLGHYQRDQASFTLKFQ